MIWVIALLGVVLAGGLAYWLLITTEGVFLGQRVVVWLYDLTAGRYDQIKEFDAAAERYLVTGPVLDILAGAPQPLLLDVATGTGRVPYDLLQAEVFAGRVVGLDASWPMLAVAANKLQEQGTTGRVQWVQAPAGRLPFPAHSFDAVTCLEALEFFPSDEAALREMVRVLKAGGGLVTTRRTGREGKWFLHRYRPEAELVALLNQLGVEDVRTYQWEVGYDLVTGRVPQTVQQPVVTTAHSA